MGWGLHRAVAGLGGQVLFARRCHGLVCCRRHVTQVRWLHGADLWRKISLVRRSHRSDVTGRQIVLARRLHGSTMCFRRDIAFIRRMHLTHVIMWRHVVRTGRLNLFHMIVWW